MIIVSGSRKGKSHVENQDAFGVRELASAGGILLAVADGIGSHVFGGSVARWLVNKRLMVDELPDDLLDPMKMESYLKGLHEIFQEEFADFEEMLTSGASLSVAVIVKNQVSCFWAGDSPVYHSHLIDSRETKLVAKPDTSPSGQLTNCFQGTKAFRINCAKFELLNSDVVTLASDGLIATTLTLTEGYSRFGVNDEFISELLEESTIHEASDDATIVAYQFAGAGDF